MSLWVAVAGFFFVGLSETADELRRLSHALSHAELDDDIGHSLIIISGNCTLLLLGTDHIHVLIFGIFHEQIPESEYNTEPLLGRNVQVLCMKQTADLGSSQLGWVLMRCNFWSTVESRFFLKKTDPFGSRLTFCWTIQFWFDIEWIHVR